VNTWSPPLARKLTCFGFYALGATEPVRPGTTHWANAQTTCQMLRALRQAYAHRALVLIGDNVRSHHAVAVRRCAEELGIQAGAPGSIGAVAFGEQVDRVLGVGGESGQ
jgi:hypothetical protein